MKCFLSFLFKPGSTQSFIFILRVKPYYPIHELKNIPEIFTTITNKLIAKNAEDRYQNILGLKEDLLECQRQLNLKGKN